MLIPFLICEVRQAIIIAKFLVTDAALGVYSPLAVLFHFPRLLPHAPPSQYTWLLQMYSISLLGQMRR